MKIRRKLPKPPRTGLPLYVVGYSSAAPALSELQTWFDLEYGGPLAVKAADRHIADSEPDAILMSYGPWRAWARPSIPLSEAEEWKTRLAWRHEAAGAIAGASGASRNIDTMLHAARLARGLTLLTQGTAYDVGAQIYLNPADWQDRPLDRFRTEDHVEIIQADATEKDLEWFYTRGLGKFGLDDLETFRPVGLPARDAMETLRDVAGEIILRGHSPNVGLSMPLPAAGVSIRVLRHRTALLGESPHILREITWSRLDPH